MPLMPLHERIIYGLVRSRRLGASLGINILPPDLKICSFNCAYCQYGWSVRATAADPVGPERWPAPEVIGCAVARWLSRNVRRRRGRLDRLTLAGHGEPTLHPDFLDVVRALREVRDRKAPGLPLAVLSNSSTLDRPDVIRALCQVDERYMKLDAGDPVTLRRVNACPVPLDDLVERLRALPAIIVQAMFVTDRVGRIDNADDAAVKAWLDAIARIRPRAVHVYTLDRAPAWPFLRPVPDARLREIARRVQAIGIPASAFPARDSE